MAEMFAQARLFVYTIKHPQPSTREYGHLSEPHYVRVKALVRERIASGQLKAGDPVASEEEWARDLGLSRLTVHRALRELMLEGLLVRFRRRGTFVADLKPQSSPITVEPIDRQIAGRGHGYRAEVVEVSEPKADAHVAEQLEVRPGTRVFRSRVVHLEDGVPIQYEDRFVNPKVVPQYAKVDFSQTTPAQYLQEHYPLRQVEHAIVAEGADAESARRLKIHESAPCLTIYRRTWSHGRVASFARLVHPGDRYRLFSRFRPQ